MIVLVIGVVTGLNVPIVPCKNRVYNLTKPPEQKSQQKIDFLFSPLGRLGNQFQVYGKNARNLGRRPRKQDHQRVMVDPMLLIV